ncbi:hypothetical protein ACHHYP_09300 [Achlya hypogyna]|uniref:Uncharacterized protein n=1 Tax=Achlya hypogyna TaxID=1202772 RepID=A0A1V9YNJ5_ACHHY|nr:hypothetical protein ACHHYP_09300 [Achlya hypogyna]
MGRIPLPFIDCVLEARFEKTKSWRAKENRISRGTFSCLWLLVAMLHALFGFHLAMLTYCHYYVTSDYYSYERRTLGLPSDLSVPALVCAVVSAGHVWCLGAMINNRRLGRRVARLSLSAETSKRSLHSSILLTNLGFRQLRAWLDAYASEKGHFGTKGALFLWRNEVHQTVSLASQTVEVYNISLSSTSSGLNLAYASCIGLNGVMAPFVRMVPLSPVLKRTLAMMLPAVLTMVLVCLLPWVAVAPYVSYFRQTPQGQNDLLYDIVWFYNAIRMGRKLFMATTVEIVTRILPCICVIFGLREVEYILSRAYDNNLRYSMAPVHLKRHHKEQSMRFKYARILRGIFIASRLTSVAWGAFVVVLSLIYSHWNYLRETCTPGCRTEVYPWFTLECRCVVQLVSCAALDIDQAQVPQTLAQLHPSALKLLILAHCPHLVVPSLARFPDLFGLEIYNSTISAWPDAITADTFTALSYVTVVRSNLTAVPYAIANPKLPPTLADIEIVYSNLRSIEDSTINAWTSLNSLILEHGQLHTLPQSLCNLDQLGDLSVFANNITEIPNATLGCLKSLTVLNLAENPITQLPSDISQGHLGLLLDLYLENTNITVWTPSAFGPQASIYLSGTPYCQKHPTEVACEPSDYDGSYPMSHVVNDGE